MSSPLYVHTYEPVQRDVHEFTVYVHTYEPVQSGREAMPDELKARRQNSRQAPMQTPLSRAATVAGTVTPASACTATAGAAPVPADRDFSRCTALTTYDRWMPQIDSVHVGDLVEAAQNLTGEKSCGESKDRSLH